MSAGRSRCGKCYTPVPPISEQPDGPLKCWTCGHSFGITLDPESRVALGQLAAQANAWREEMARRGALQLLHVNQVAAELRAKEQGR